MKKTIRFIALMLVIVTVCLSFCSCAELDEAKANQAFFSQNDDGIIYFREKEYKQLPYCEDLYIRSTFSGRVTDYDVPVLIKEWYGNVFFYSDDLKFIELHGEKYCLKELYDEYYNKILSYKLDNYCIEDYYYDEEKHEMFFEYIVLDAKAKQALDDILNNFEPAKPLGNEVLSKSVLICDEKAEFVRYHARLVKTTDGFYIAIDDKGYEASYYKATEEYAEILEPYLQNEKFDYGEDFIVTEPVYQPY